MSRWQYIQVTCDRCGRQEAYPHKFARPEDKPPAGWVDWHGLDFCSKACIIAFIETVPEPNAEPAATPREAR